MHTVTFHNLANADCTRINLENGRKILFDYADMRDPDDASDLRCDLPQKLREDLGDRDYYDVVAFSHLDRDHYAGATDFFYFEHIAAYQGEVAGQKRVEMRVLWVPAAVITEKLGTSDDAEAKAIQKEARERFKVGDGVRVFSCPGRLEDWCEANGVDIEKRRHLITDAGQLVPEFTLEDDSVEFFVHSPFAVRQDEHTVEDRNCDAIVMQATFTSDGALTKLILASDVTHGELTDIVRVTEAKGREERLEWDIFKLPHHCSHHSLSAKPREGDKSEPEPMVARLFEHYGQDDCVVVSTSDPIPEASNGDDKGANPPHRQAANYYREDVVTCDDDFKVTMEHPDTDEPAPLVIQIDGCGTTVKKVRRAAAFVATTSTAPRAG